MRGTVSQKLGRLAVHLLLHPQYIPRCLAHNVLNGKTPVDLELPWFSYAAIDFLEDYLQPDMRVCEYGSGGSTLFFARRTKSVLSIEDNPRWFEIVRARLKEKNVQNAVVKLCQFDFKNPVGFEGSEYLHAIPDETFDVIVIDGSEEWTQVRPACFEKAEGRIRRGGIIVVDDSWRYPVLREKHHAKWHRVFQSVGPCRPGVTSTDVFFY
jgi:predicted O-methyltransferase YrrM